MNAASSLNLLNFTTTRIHGFLIGNAFHRGFPGSASGKESSCDVGDLGLIPGLGRSPGEGKGYPLKYSGPENSLTV